MNNMFIALYCNIYDYNHTIYFKIFNNPIY